MNEYINIIDELILESNSLYHLNTESDKFIRWIERAKMIVKKVFGETSTEYNDFINISFVEWNFAEYPTENVNNDFIKGIDKCRISLEVFKEQIVLTSNMENVMVTDKNKKVSKIFISHSSKDKEYVDLILEMLNFIGVEKSYKRIFYSSKEGYGVPLAENIYDYLKAELNNDIMVLFILSDNYYSSIPCLNEMGATWVTSKEYYSILLPFFEFKSLKGAIDPSAICLSIEN
ncbi:toll/interleukin-1 receptor domain-containing protein, partial [Ruminiclostridium hungatei]|uniref:toll/interleukin-1 receptor domain-containing protein n=1 Tax=Ruminiclostridium hungatei TaxID=48256 RepID=UPI000E3C3C70